MMDCATGQGVSGLTMVLSWLVPLILVVVGIKYLYSDRGIRQSREGVETGLILMNFSPRAGGAFRVRHSSLI